MNTMKLETYAGDTFNEVANSAKALAFAHNTTVEFDFNGIRCLVNESTDTDLLYRNYSDTHIMEWKEVGPVCLPEYDDATAAELKTRRDASDKRQQAAQKEYDEKCAKEKATVEAVTGNVVLLIHSDKQKDYEKYVATNSTDGYSRVVIDYGEQWAKLMQVEIAKGRTNIADIADECQKPLSYLGITGFQYGCVVKGLAHFWVFGEELRRWHNKEYGVSEDKAGVVNPAILTIG
jgi:hypothetical protein